MEYKVGDTIKSGNMSWDVVDVKGGPGKSGFGIVYLCALSRSHFNELMSSTISHFSELKETFSFTLPIIAIKSFQDKFFQMEREIADKVMKDFYHEAEIWVKLGKHKNIVEALAVDYLDLKPHILAEYVDGGDLKERLEKGPLNIREALFSAIQFCDGMIYANSVDLGGGIRGIVHRDIKPGNIMFTKEGLLKITDFGLIKALGRWQVAGAGTPEYMSPEQFETVDVDTRADIYSFGVVLYEMLCGWPSFYKRTIDGKERWMFYKYHHQEVLPRPLREMNSSVPEKLELVVMRCLEKNPSDRYQNFEALREELAEIYQSQFGQIPETKERVSAPEKHLASKGSMLLALGKTEEAIPFFNSALEIDPRLIFAWIDKGMALSMLRRHGEAMECFDKALEIDPRNADAWIRKGSAFHRQGRHREAIECFDRAIMIDHRSAIAWYNKGLVLSELGRREEALRCFDRALEIDPRNTVVFIAKGYVLRDLGKYKEALRSFDKMLEVFPRSPEAWCQKGEVLGSLGKHSEAVKCFDKALEIDARNAGAWYNKGVALRDMGKDGEAVDCFYRASNLNPGNVDAWANNGLCLVKLGRYTEAIQCSDKALEINPRYAGAWASKGLALYLLGRVHEALDCFRKAVAIEPSMRESLKALNIYM